MAGNTNAALQKWTLIFIIVSLVGWGIPLLLVPKFLFMDIGGATDAVAPFYSRYGGAWFIGIGVAAIIALMNASRVRAIFELCAVAGGLSFLALIIDYFAGTVPIADWLIWAAIIDALVICVLSVAARAKS
jgi:hypothetical protein